jgi:hypothetical protein
MQLTLEETLYMAVELQTIHVAQDLQKDSCLEHDSDVDIDSSTPMHTLCIDELWQYCCNRAASFPQRYAVYRHFARKG